MLLRAPLILSLRSWTLDKHCSQKSVSKATENILQAKLLAWMENEEAEQPVTVEFTTRCLNACNL